jgi:hypothetical protein
VLLCWLALLPIRVAERRTATTWRTINRELGRILCRSKSRHGTSGRVSVFVDEAIEDASALQSTGV